MKLRDALRLAREAGLVVEPRRRHGEWKIGAPGRPSIMVNARVKDASKALVLYIRKAQGLVGTNWRSSE